ANEADAVSRLLGPGRHHRTASVSVTLERRRTQTFVARKSDGWQVTHWEPVPDGAEPQGPPRQGAARRAAPVVALIAVAALGVTWGLARGRWPRAGAVAAAIAQPSAQLD